MGEAGGLLSVLSSAGQRRLRGHASVIEPTSEIFGAGCNLLECLWQIPALAIPAFVILTFAVRYLAPTNLIRTGAYMGLVAGGIGAIGYAFHCHDDSVAFVAVSYTLAIAEMTVVGALLGPRILRWTSHSRTA